MAGMVLSVRLLSGVATSLFAMQLYSLKRLVRGLGSGRQAARQGFALSLTLVLSSIKSIPVQGILKLVEVHLPNSKSQKV